MEEQLYNPLAGSEAMPESPNTEERPRLADELSTPTGAPQASESPYPLSSSPPVPPWSRLRKLHYTEAESCFLYLVATHSGYFTLAQFLRFCGRQKGWASHHFTEKLLSRGHAQADEYGRKTFILHLHAQALYDTLNRDGLRFRRRNSPDQIRSRLMILDLVLAHPQHNYLETEAEKIDYFHQALGVPLEFFPQRRFPKTAESGPIQHYFLDGFPIFLPQTGGSGPPGLASAVTFTYCDSGYHSLDYYAAHLRAYARLLRRLPVFNFIFASPDGRKNDRAAALFEELFEPRGRIDVEALQRYFRLRDRWDGPQSASLTREERDELRVGMRRFEGKIFEELYLDWMDLDFTQDELKAKLDTYSAWPESRFHTVQLPDGYDILKPRCY